MKHKKIILGISLLVIILLSFLVHANIYVLKYNSFVYDVKSVPTSTLALVFGGGMDGKDQMSAMQTDRVIKGIELYKTGKVKKIMMTGDDGSLRDDEVTAMKKYALENGVPEVDILVDPHGYRTYESCYRERFVYGITSTIVVSQAFHLPRILYFCRSFGIETVGVMADLRPYGDSQTYSDIREIVARPKGWWQMAITKPLPLSLEK